MGDKCSSFGELTAECWEAGIFNGDCNSTSGPSRSGIFGKRIFDILSKWGSCQKIAPGRRSGGSLKEINGPGTGGWRGCCGTLLERALEILTLSRSITLLSS